MVRRRSLPGERLEMYSPIGLIPIDSLTSKAPLGRMEVSLDIRDDMGMWRQTDIKEVRTANGLIAYPGLGRSALVAGQPPRRYRVRVDAEFYFPFYALTVPPGTEDGIEFNSFPCNDTNPPGNYPKQPADFPLYLAAVLKKLWLVPAPNYPFPDHMRVLRGVVVDRNTKQPVVGAQVTWGVKEKTLTGSKGAFSLPLRVSKPEDLTAEQKIDATDGRTPPKQGTRNIIIPKALGTNLTITIS